MLEMLEQFIEPYSPRLIPAWNQYVQYIETYTQPIMKRFMLATDASTKGIAMLRYILSCADWNYLLKPGSDFNKYIYHVRFVKDDLENTFDHTTNGFRYFNCFTGTQLGKVQEFIIPVEDVTSASTLPFDKGWSYWKDIRPVRYLSHDSQEFTINIEKDVVRFYKEKPSYAIISIDVVALIFKYMKYLMEAPDDPEYEGKDQRRFLHKYVLSGFMRDLTDIFLIQQMNTVASVGSIEELREFTQQNVSSDQMYGFVGHRYHEASTVFYREIENIKSGQLRPRSLLSSPLLTRRVALNERAFMIDENLDVPRLRQYQFYRFLRDKDMFNLILKLYKFRADDPLCERLERHVKPKIYKLMRDKIWLYMKDSTIRSKIEQDLLAINDLLDFSE